MLLTCGCVFAYVIRDVNLSSMFARGKSCIRFTSAAPSWFLPKALSNLNDLAHSSRVSSRVSFALPSAYSPRKIVERRRQNCAFPSAPPREIVAPHRQNRRALPSAPRPREIVGPHRQNQRTLPSAPSPLKIVVSHRQNRQFSSMSCDRQSYSLHLIKKAASDSKREKQDFTQCNDFCNFEQ